MLISVIIPTYNRSSLVKEAINSVLAQTYINFELLIVDDYSQDNTEEVVREYNDHRVVFLKNKRTKGAQGARNTGLLAAKGEYVALLDSDDVWLPIKLEKQINLLCRLSDDVIGISTGVKIFDFNNYQVIKEYIPKKDSFTTQELLYANKLGPAFSSFLFKRQVGLEVGGFDEDFPAMQDMDFYISLSRKGRIAVLREPLCLIRINNSDRISIDFASKLKAAELLSQKYSDIVGRSFRQRANRYMRILYYSLKAGKKYKIRPVFILYMAIADPEQFKSLLSAYIK